MTAEYEQETVKARLESQREEAIVTADFKREVETKILNKIGTSLPEDKFDIIQEIQEIINKYGDEKCMRYQLPLLVVKRIAQKELRQASRQWDVKEQPLFLYNKYYEIREILAVCG